MARGRSGSAGTALQQQCTCRQQRFSLPKNRELLQVGDGRRKILHPNGVQLPSDVVCYQSGGVFLTVRVIPAEVENGRVLRICFKNMSRLRCGQMVLRGNPVGDSAGLHKRLQLRIQ